MYFVLLCDITAPKPPARPKKQDNKFIFGLIIKVVAISIRYEGKGRLGSSTPGPLTAPFLEQDTHSNQKRAGLKGPLPFLSLDAFPEQLGQQASVPDDTNRGT